MVDGRGAPWLGLTAGDRGIPIAHRECGKRAAGDRGAGRSGGRAADIWRDGSARATQEGSG